MVVESVSAMSAVLAPRYFAAAASTRASAWELLSWM